jgi:hypothetical protein
MLSLCLISPSPVSHFLLWILRWKVLLYKFVPFVSARSAQIIVTISSGSLLFWSSRVNFVFRRIFLEQTSLISSRERHGDQKWWQRSCRRPSDVYDNIKIVGVCASARVWTNDHQRIYSSESSSRLLRVLLREVQSGPSVDKQTTTDKVWSSCLISRAA